MSESVNHCSCLREAMEDGQRPHGPRPGCAHSVEFPGQRQSREADIAKVVGPKLAQVVLRHLEGPAP